MPRSSSSRCNPCSSARMEHRMAAALGECYWLRWPPSCGTLWVSCAEDNGGTDLQLSIRRPRHDLACCEPAGQSANASCKRLPEALRVVDVILHQLHRTERTRYQLQNSRQVQTYWPLDLGTHVSHQAVLAKKGRSRSGRFPLGHPLSIPRETHYIRPTSVTALSILSCCSRSPCLQARPPSSHPSK